MKVQEALKAALAAIDLYDYTGTQAESELYAKAESLCKSALSEIEKCEPVAYMYQHEETGNIGFIDQWQVDNGFEKNNPRLKIITSLYTSPQPIEKCEPVINLNILKYTEHGVIPDDFKGQASGYRAGWNDCLSSVQYMFSQPIENCEPVAWLVYAKGSRGYFTLTFDVDKVPQIYLGGEAIPLFPSPISKEREDWQYFDEAYKKATESSEPDDWMNAALMAQQVRRKQLNAKKG